MKVRPSLCDTCTHNDTSTTYCKVMNEYNKSEAHLCDDMGGTCPCYKEIDEQTLTLQLFNEMIKQKSL